jgi:hypothetical protein
MDRTRGKAMGSAHPLDGLLHHCQRTAGESRRKAERYWAQVAEAEDGYRRTSRETWAQHQDAITAQWQAWHDALAALMHGEDGPHGGFQSPPQE